MTEALENAKNLISEGRLDLARDMLEKIMAEEPSSPQLSFEMGKVLYMRGENSRAAGFLRDAVLGAPENLHARLLLAKTSLELGDPGSAAEELGKLRSSGFEDEDVIREYAKALFALGKNEEAKNCLEDLLCGREGSYEEMFMLAKINKELGLYSSAGKILSGLKNSNPDSAEILSELTQVMQELNEASSAIEMVSGREDLIPERASLYAAQGRRLLEQGDTAGADRCFGEALGLGLDADELRDELFEIKKTAAYSDWEAGDLQAALAAFRDMSDRRPDDEKLIADMGRLCIETADYESAERIFGGLLSRKDSARPAASVNRLSIYREMSLRKTELEARPRILMATLTSRCNIECIMCQFCREKWDIPEKTAGEIYCLLPFLQEVSWQGGEVFLSPHFERLFDAASSNKDLRQIITTNGLLLDDEWIDKLTDNRVTVIFSIDSPVKRTYEHIRRGAAFEKLLDVLSEFKKVRERKLAEGLIDRDSLVVKMNLVVMRSNYRELYEALDFAESYGFDFLHFNPVDFGPENIFEPEDAAAMDHIRRISPELEKKSADMNLQLLNLLPYARSDIREDAKISRGDMPDEAPAAPADDGDYHDPVALLCHMPWQCMYIHFDGSVKPHCVCKTSAGNIEDQGLMDIWNGPMMRRYRQLMLDEKQAAICSERCISGIIPSRQLKEG